MATIPEILKSTHAITVVGLSSDPMRPSNGVGEYLVRAGYRVIPVKRLVATHGWQQTSSRRQESLDAARKVRTPQLIHV